MVRDVDVRADGRVGVLVALTVAGCPLRNEIQQPGDGGRAAARRRGRRRPRLHRDDRRGARGAAPAAARRPGATRRAGAGPRPRRGTADPLRRARLARPGPLLIASGKGGVGKSSVTTNLAVALAQRGHSVGVIDADVYGFSIPRMLGTDRDPVVIDQMLLPPEQWGVRCISIGYFVPEGQAVIWRGPMLHKALEQFLTDVYWDDPDFLLVDMPPGTGDIAARLSQYLPRAEVLVVTTPAAGGAEGGAAVGGHGREGQPRGEGRHREHVVVHRRRRQALRALRRRRRPGAGRRARRAAARRRSRCSRRCARAATTAGRSRRSLPTARRRAPSGRWPSAIAVELAPRRSSARSCASADGPALSRLTARRIRPSRSPNGMESSRGRPHRHHPGRSRDARRAGRRHRSGRARRAPSTPRSGGAVDTLALTDRRGRESSSRRRRSPTSRSAWPTATGASASAADRTGRRRDSSTTACSTTGSSSSPARAASARPRSPPRSPCSRGRGGQADPGLRGGRQGHAGGGLRGRSAALRGRGRCTPASTPWP